MTVPIKSISQQLRDYYQKFPVDDDLMIRCRERWALPIEPQIAMDLTIAPEAVERYLRNRVRNDNVGRFRP